MPLISTLEPAVGVPAEGGEIKAQTPIEVWAALVCAWECAGLCTSQSSDITNLTENRTPTAATFIPQKVIKKYKNTNNNINKK